MELTFCGAAREVTGSCHLVEACGKKFIVDCGLIQGREIDEEKNYDPFLFDPKEIDFMILTHAHIDHSGRIPKLIKDGFKGKIYATKATVDLCGIMLPDSGHIQETEIEWKNRKRERQGKALLEPLYTAKEASECMEYFESCSYQDIIEYDEQIRFRFSDAGHMLGSAIIEVWVTENGKTQKIVFSGDLGNDDIPLLQSPSKIASADYVVMESTYGNRLHLENDAKTKAEKFLNIVVNTLRRGGNVVIPSFAVGRTQEIVYELDTIKDKTADKKLQEEYKELMQAKVYVDSPLATLATNIYKQNMDLFDQKAQERVANGDDPLEFEGLTFTTTPEESVELNFLTEPMVIISASGMCDAGRIKHHLKHNLWNPLNTILFVGYQALNTLGRRIVDGAKIVKIFGEEIAVKAQVEYIEGYSGHADQTALMDFVRAFKEKPKKVFLVHGEIEAQEVLASKIQEELGISTVIPIKGEMFKVGEIFEKQGNVARNSEEKVKRHRKFKFASRVSDIDQDLSILTNQVLDDMVIKPQTNKKLTSETDKAVLKQILAKLDYLKAEIQQLVKDSEECDGCDEEEKQRKLKEYDLSDEVIESYSQDQKNEDQKEIDELILKEREKAAKKGA